MRVFMTGATGMIGQPLSEALSSRGDSVLVLSRGVRAGPEGVEFVAGNPADPEDWGARVAGCDAVIHLAGEPVGRWRWSDHVKHKIFDSRVLGAKGLVSAIVAAPPERRPHIFLCASSTDFYAFASGDDRFGEAGPVGDHFLAAVAAATEAAADAASAVAVRVVALRCGLVVGADRDALERYTGPFSLAFRSPAGSGEQWFSWVHIEDVVAGYLWALDHPLRGPVNLVAPGEIRQGDFARALAAAQHRDPQPISETKIRNSFGELGEYILKGRRVTPTALIASGFRFRRPDAPAAIAAFYGSS